MAPKCLLDLMKRFNALDARLPLPKHDKTLTTDATMCFSVAIRALAKNLHADLVRVNLKQQKDNIAGDVLVSIPRLRKGMPLSGHPQIAFRASVRLLFPLVPTPWLFAFAPVGLLSSTVGRFSFLAAPLELQTYDEHAKHTHSPA